MFDTPFVQFIPKYFILYKATVNKIIKLLRLHTAEHTEI